MRQFRSVIIDVIKFQDNSKEQRETNRKQTKINGNQVAEVYIC